MWTRRAGPKLSWSAYRTAEPPNRPMAHDSFRFGIEEALSMADTDLPPWVPPSPEENAVARPAKEALKEALREIKTPDQAAHVADEVVAAAGDTTEKQVREQGSAAPAPAQAVQETAAATPGVEKAPATLVEAAKQVAGSTGETREALEQALQKATNPEQRGIHDPARQEPLDLLREAILQRMKPYQAFDARL